MEQYKKTLSKKIGLVMLFSGLLLILIVYLLFFSSKEPVVGAFAHAALIGFAFGIDVIAIFYTHQYSKALKDETLLKKIYYEDHDERLSMIRMKSGYPSLTIAGTIFLIASAIAAYFDAAVTYTLLGGAFFLFLLQLGFFFYNGRKY